MPKIRDLGINSIPATMRLPQIGLGAFGTPPKEPPPCPPPSPPPPPKPGGPKPGSYFSADDIAVLRRQLDEAL